MTKGAFRLPLYISGGETPSTSGGGIFTGATIPLTYKDNTHTYENEYVYASATHDITIEGLTGRATITGNGSKSVTVTFDVTSETSSLKNFTITCVKGSETLAYNGMHAHYGTTVTGILTFAYTNVTKDGSEGTIGTNYLFVETGSTTLPLFPSATTIWNGLYSYQILNVLIANYSSTNIGAYFLMGCYEFNQPITIPSSVFTISTNFLVNCPSFNQPLTIPSNVTSLGNYFLNSCYAFNQPITFQSVSTVIGAYFLKGCYAFNQPITIPSSVASIETNFLDSCYAFNQPITIPSSVASIGNNFLVSCVSFNQPITIPSSVTTIGTNFLVSCVSFNQPITIPSNVTSIGIYFLHQCYCFSAINYEASVYPTDNYSLSQTINSKTSASGSGIIIYGTNRAGLIVALPNRTSSPYRKLIDGGS